MNRLLFQRKVWYFFLILCFPFIMVCMSADCSSVYAAKYDDSQDVADENLDDIKLQDNIDEIEDDYYKSFYDTVEMDELTEEIKEITGNYGKENDISFDMFYKMMLEGKVDEAIEQAVNNLCSSIGDEIIKNRQVILKMVALVVVAAIFNSYSSVLKFSFVGEQGFFITYLMIAVLLMQSFMMIYDVAEESVYYIKDLTTCMLPAFYMSLAMCTGLTTSQMVNTMFLTMLAVVEKLLLLVILPGTRIYFLIVILNQINQKDRFSKLAGLIKQGLTFGLKAIVTGIIGLNLMKSILLPVYDNAKYNVLQKGLSVVPGGASLSGLSTILVGAGVLIKNSVGLAAVVILLVLGSIPLIKIFCFFVVYKVILALIQPISDSRILAGIQGAVDSTGVLLRATATSIILSILSIAIVLLTTNVRLYAG
ncbi:MAG: stage III sporulation protein AE [Lachnospiraceae bacterium]|nr:stage III sporulation protein AE [Lachnospiraceae bacterium]